MATPRHNAGLKGMKHGGGGKVNQIDPHGGSPGSDKFLKRQRVRAIRRGANPKGYRGYQT